MSRRYTVDPCPVLEDRLERHFEAVRHLLSGFPEAERQVDALVLGGGYGRGEGGVCAGDDGEPLLFNDLDYFLFCADPGDAHLREAVHAIEKAGTTELGIDVDVKCLTLDEMGDPETSMMFYDLVAGHCVVIGDDDFLSARFPKLGGASIQPIEASRLLWNRGTGLYFSACRIARRAERAFVIRNHAKFRLAAGDALLCLDGLYNSSVSDRLERFREHRPDRTFGIELLSAYEAAVAFKLRPQLDDDASWEELAEENRRLSDLWSQLFLHSESRRLGTAFASPSDYVAGQERRSPEIPRWKAPLFALRDWLRYRKCLAPVWDYPRNALFRSLFCLLSDDSTRHRLPSPAKFLGRRPEARHAAEITAWEPIYHFWWQRYG